jgi:hypothetical protein
MDLSKRFGHMFYVANALIVVSFIAVRLRLGHKMSAESEQQDKAMWGVFSVMMLVRFRRLPSIESFLGMFFLYSKLVMLISCYLMDKRMAIIYATLFLSNFLAFAKVFLMLV